VTNGSFSAIIDFGSGVFTGSNYWLQVALRTNGSGSFTSLSPRQPILPTPYAIYSASAGNAATANTALTAGSASSISATNITGTIPLAQLPAMVVTNDAASLTVGGTTVVAPLTVPPLGPASATGSVGTGSNPPSVAVAGRYAYVANQGSNTMQVFDVSNPTNPVSVGSVNTGTGPDCVAVAGRYAYVAEDGGTLQIFDVSTPSAPIGAGSVSTGSTPYSVAVAGRYAYVVNLHGNTLQVFDLGGAYIQQLEAGAMETGTLQTRDTVTVGNNLNVRGGFTASGSARISGGLSVDNGTIAGNGSGLTNLTANALTGGFTTNILVGGHTFYITNGLIMNIQ